DPVAQRPDAAAARRPRVGRRPALPPRRARVRARAGLVAPPSLGDRARRHRDRPRHRTALRPGREDVPAAGRPERVRDLDPHTGRLHARRDVAPVRGDRAPGARAPRRHGRAGDDRRHVGTGEGRRRRRDQLIDREKASDQGINVQDIAATVQTYVAGQPISKYKEADEQYDIWLRAEAGHRRTPEDVGDLTVRARGGALVRLRNLVRLSEDVGPAEIDRVNRQRAVTIVANLLPELPLATAVAHVNRVAAQLDMPPLYNVQWTGRAKTLAESNINFLLAFGLSIVF